MDGKHHSSWSLFPSVQLNADAWVSSSRVSVHMCGPVSTGPEAGLGLSFMGETASGSGSSVIDMPFPFFLDISGVTISWLAELLVLQVLFQ